MGTIERQHGSRRIRSTGRNVFWPANRSGIAVRVTDAAAHEQGSNQQELPKLDQRRRRGRIAIVLDDGKRSVGAVGQVRGSRIERHQHVERHYVE